MGRAKTASGAPECFLSGIFRAGGLVLFIPWRVGAEESGAAKYGFGGCDAAGPARAAWAVQRLLAARWRGRRRRRRRFRFSDFRFGAVAAPLSGTGSASPRPDRNSWLRGAIRRALSPDFSAGALAVFIPWRLGAEESGAAKLLDLRGPPGRCSGCWPHDGEVAGGAVADFVLVISGSGRWPRRSQVRGQLRHDPIATAG